VIKNKKNKIFVIFFLISLLFADMVNWQMISFQTPSEAKAINQTSLNSFSVDTEKFEIDFYTIESETSLLPLLQKTPFSLLKTNLFSLPIFSIWQPPKI
jgi:hypothetical protein